MSRIYVKNLSRNVTEECLQEHFGKIGQINDLNLKNINGKFKGYCFIGYETTELAERACQEFNNTRFKQSTISVKPARQCDQYFCKPAGGGSRNFEVIVEKWNDTFNVKVHMSKGTKSKCKGLRKKILIEFFHPLVLSKVYIPRKNKFLAFVAFSSKKEMLQAIQKDNSFINTNKIQISIIAETTPKPILPWQMSAQKAQKAKPVSETAKIFIRNLSYTITEDDLQAFFGKIGPVRGISLPICRESSKPKGFAHVSFFFPEHAVKALNLDGSDLKGRVLHILPSNLDEEEEVESVPFQQKKENKKKASASSWHNWNMLFLGANAVMNIMAKSNATTKLKMLEEDDPNFAVNLALEETNIVRDTKQFLEDNGVSIDAFSNPAMERSGTVILAKNLPDGTTADEINEKFSKFGDLNKVILPEHGITAIIEFVHRDHAVTAFKKLAYKQFKYLPLYLEWAPIQIFKEHQGTPCKKEISKERKDEENVPSEVVTAEVEIEPEANASVYVKNINFSTTEDCLKEFFSSCGNVKSSLIAKKGLLSQGYGFVQYYKRSHAKRALLKLHGSTLHQHQLQVEMSKKIVENEISGRRATQDAGHKTIPKIIVKNIPFQATLKEIRQLFKTFGSLRTVRLPLKYEQHGEHRGFCFIDFSTMEDAERAFKELSASTHLYGRRLVLEWAKQDESVEELMQKTAKNFMASGPPRKKIKHDIDENEYRDII